MGDMCRGMEKITFIFGFSHKKHFELEIISFPNQREKLGEKKNHKTKTKQ